eukprot:scaffold2294_cov106-Cylindrotheca_fusiformis.AAC.8
MQFRITFESDFSGSTFVGMEQARRTSHSYCQQRIHYTSQLISELLSLKPGSELWQPYMKSKMKTTAGSISSFSKEAVPHVAFVGAGGTADTVPIGLVCEG